jgi:hypothetical protein
MILQKWRGYFCNPLVIETLVAHFTASDGAKEVLGLNDASEATPAATGILGMVAASVRIVFCRRVIVLTTFRWREHSLWFRRAR